jgi:hypothetical protein
MAAPWVRGGCAIEVKLRWECRFRIMQTMFGKIRGPRGWMATRRRGDAWGPNGRENTLKRIVWLANVR